MKVKLKYIDSKRFFYKTVDEQDYLILFKKDMMNLSDNQYNKMCDEIINVVKKEGFNLFVSDIVERIGYSDEIRSILKESLYIYVFGYPPIVASEIKTDDCKLLYRGKKIAELEYIQNNSSKKIIWGLLLLTIILVSYYYISDNNRKKDNLTEYQHDCNILDSLSNYLASSTDSSSFSYIRFITSDNLFSIKYTIDSLRQCADSCFNATKDNGKYIPLAFDSSLVINSIHKIITEAKELEKADIEKKRRGTNDMMYTKDFLLISSLKDYLEEKTSHNEEYAKHINYVQVSNIKQMLDSLSLEAVQSHTDVLDSGNYMQVFVDTGAIKAEINEIVLSANNLLTKEKQQKKTKTTSATPRKRTRVQHSTPSKEKTTNQKRNKVSLSEKKFLEYKKRGDEAYVRYYKSGSEKFRSIAIEQYTQALLLKNDNVITRKLKQLKK